MRIHLTFTIISSVCLAATTLQAAPLVPLSASGYDRDIVYAASDPKGVNSPSTSAEMDFGDQNSGFGNTWYGVGFNPDALSTGLPQSPTFSQSSGAEVAFQLQPFTSNNALLLEAGLPMGEGGPRGPGEVGTLTLTTPQPLLRLAVFGATGNGVGDVAITVTHLDATTESFIGSMISQDWFNGDGVAYTAAGRYSALGGFDAVNSGNPRLYQDVFTLANASPVTSITFQNNGGGNAAIMAISGEPAQAANAVPEAGMGSLGLLSLAFAGMLAIRRTC